MNGTDKARDHLNDILQQQEYQVYYEDNRNIFQILWDKAKEWLGEKLLELLALLNPAGGLSNLVFLLIAVGVVVLIGVVIFLAIRRTGRRRRLSSQSPLRTGGEMHWSHQEHLDEADRQEQNGDYSAAARHVFLALLLYFHERGLLEARIWKTNWEYAAELKQTDTGRAEQFYSLALLFDEAVYGKRKLTQTEYKDYRDRAMQWMNTDHQEASGNGE